MQDGGGGEGRSTCRLNYERVRNFGLLGLVVLSLFSHWRVASAMRVFISVIVSMAVVRIGINLFWVFSL